MHNAYYFVILRAKYKKRANKYDMNLLDIILLAVALAMDCFTVSIVSGVLFNGQWTMDNGQLSTRSNNYPFSIFHFPLLRMPGHDAVIGVAGHQPFPNIYGGL